VQVNCKVITCGAAVKFIDKQDIKMKNTVFWLRLVRTTIGASIGKGISVKGSTTSPNKISILENRIHPFNCA
jgi:hypothetical protein